MADESSDAINLGLSLSPISNPEPLSGSMPRTSETLNVPKFMEEEPARRIRLVRRLRTRQQRRRQRQRLLIGDSGNVGSSQAGEGSVSAEERVAEVPKSCENKNDDTGKSGDNFYCCSICFDLAKDPVVTCCGHLFCWPCLFRWLYEFSDDEQCPVCKEEAAIENLTPIYGCGSGTHGLEKDCDLRIPARPKRSSTSRQQHMLEEIEKLQALTQRMFEEIRVMKLKRVRRDKKDRKWRKKIQAHQKMLYQHINDPTNPIPKYPDSSSDSEDSD